MKTTEFLEARIAEDEAQIREWDRSSPFSAERLLAECAAKRKILELHGAYTGDYDESGNYLLIVEVMAEVYKDHPDYRQEWPE